MATDVLAPPIAARPTVTVDGSVAAGLVDGLTRLRIHEGADGVATLELEAGNWAVADAGGGVPSFRFFDRRTVEFGKPIEVRHGEATLFRGRITAIEGVFAEQAPPALVVLAEDALQDLRMTRRTRSFADCSDADVVRRIAGDHGLTAQVDLPGPVHRQVAQLNQSDLAFVRDRVRRAGGELWVAGRELHAAPRTGRGGGGAPSRLALGAELRELRVRADLAHQATSVRVQGWDVAAKEAIAEEATDSVLAAETIEGQSGAAILRETFGERRQTVVATAPGTQAAARAEAEAVMRLRGRRFVRGCAVCETRAGVHAGATVRIAGVGALFSGDYAVAEVVHRFDGAHGLRTEAVVERAGLGRSS